MQLLRKICAALKAFGRRFLQAPIDEINERSRKVWALVRQRRVGLMDDGVE
jgi:hypothetical protein